MYAYLTMTVGPRAGQNFLLDPSGENLLGRGTECCVILTDPLCSRVHAAISRSNGNWEVRDASSRNGTFVNEQRIDEPVRLSRGHHVRIGSSEFSFNESTIPPPLAVRSETDISQTLVKETRVGQAGTAEFALGAMQDPEQIQDVLLLHQLAIKLLGCADPRTLTHDSLDLLRMRSKASVVGFLWRNEDGLLKPKLVIPEESADHTMLNEELTRLVCDKRHAVWIANQQHRGGADSLEHFADALCVPLVRDDHVLGAVHVYLERGRFRQSHFDFAISLANITAVALARALHEESLSTSFRRLREVSPGYDELIGESSPMLELKQKISRLAPASGCVLVRGESGTGKELVARALHHASPRSGRPLVAVNCAAIPPDLMDSQLFGHKAGSFTGADRDHDGFFKQADQGTLFLDEVGELTLAGQSKLLRILEGHPFLPVGGTKEVQVDVRVIAATNRDLLEYVKEKSFREDLYYRLNVFEIIAPPLRERGSDIGLLVDFFLDRFRSNHGRPTLELSPEARRKLLGYSWPGNVRQLRNVIDSAVVLAGGQRIEPADLPLREETAEQPLESLRIEDWERRLIGEALRRTAGNVPEAARLLGIGRATLYRKIEQYGVARS